MGSIQWKRGSSRGAPPQVYQSFFSAPDSDENVDNWKATGWILLVITLMIFGLGFLGMFLEYVGLWKPD